MQRGDDCFDCCQNIDHSYQSAINEGDYRLKFSTFQDESIVLHLKTLKKKKTRKSKKNDQKMQGHKKDANIRIFGMNTNIRISVDILTLN